MKLYPANTLVKLEFDQLTDRLAEKCRSEKAKSFARQLAPLSNLNQISRLLDQTHELTEIRRNGLFFPELAFPNIGTELKSLSIVGTVLQGEQFVKLQRLCITATQVRRFLSEKRNEYPALFEVVESLEKSKPIVGLIEQVLEPNGYVKSSASRALGDIRQQLTQVRQKTARAFESAMRKYKKLGWLREFGETFYNDRRVLAVISEFKRQIDGNIHGLSESGATAFIEPSALIHLNNEVFEHKQAETREEQRILKELTDAIRPFAPHLEQYEQAMGFLDFTFAKAGLAIDLNAHKPLLGKNRITRMENAIHPVLYLQNKAQDKPTNPVSFELTPQQRILVISGPNAGGKSVTIKTLGLLQLMVQAGLLIPAEAHSEMTLFQQLFVDIGDDQSIAFELSTYSSRLKKMQHFLKFAAKNTLFLIDEFGTGSDPELGGAMAEAILEDLVQTGAQGVVTTHYSNIKILAEQNKALQNASMLFDEKTLQPKYRLQVGHPGSSYTFEVAQKIGLPPDLINRAREKLDSRKVNLDKLLVTLQAKKNQLNRETHRLQVEKSNLRQEAQRKAEEAEKFSERERELNFEENKKLIEKGKKYDSLLEFWQTDKNRKELLHRIIMASEKEAEKARAALRKQKETEKKQRLEKQAKNKKRKQKAAVKPLPPKPIVEGSTVRLANTRQTGVVESIAKEKATVVFGIMKTIVPLKDLKLIP